MNMRGTLGAIGLLVVGGMLVAEGPLDAHALGGLNAVTVSPVHGKANFTFQATYAIIPCQAAAGLTIGFSWGALPPAGQVLGTATTDGNCRATLSTTPPMSAATHQSPAAGSYRVFGYVALPTGTPAPNTEASASYTVDVTSPTSKPGASASGAASAPAATDQAATAPTAADGNLLVAHPGSRQLWWTLAWPVGRGAVVLALLLLATLLLLAAWLLRRRRPRATPHVSADRAA
jgi:hypothetical protein